MPFLLLRYPPRQDWYFGEDSAETVLRWVFPELGDDVDTTTAMVLTAEACQAAEGRDFEQVRQRSRYLRMTPEDMDLYVAPKDELFDGDMPKSWGTGPPLYLTREQLGPGRDAPVGSVEVLTLAPSNQLRHLIDACVLEDLAPGAFRA